MTNSRFLALASFAVAASLGLAACGPGDSAAPSGDSPASDPGVGGATSLTVVTLDTFRFEPADVSASAGATVSLMLDNTGQTQEHSWVLLPAGATSADAMALPDPPPDDQILWELRVNPGETATGTFQAPAAGTYIVVCAVPGHAAGGMLGSLTVN